jgi:hypothetical protein
MHAHDGRFSKPPGSCTSVRIGISFFSDSKYCASFLFHLNYAHSYLLMLSDLLNKEVFRYASGSACTVNPIISSNK